MVKFEDKGHERELMLMEKIGEDGERREAGAAEVARVDQIMARQEEISHRLAHLHARIEEAVRAQDSQTVAALTRLLRDMMYDYFPMDYDVQASKDVVDFVLYLIGLLNSFSEVQKQIHQTADALLHGVITLLPEGHPLVDSEYFDRDVMVERLAGLLPDGLPEDILGRLNPRDELRGDDHQR